MLFRVPRHSLTLLAVVLLVCLWSSGTRAARTKKASPADLLRIKELINRRAEREVGQSDVGALADDAIVVPRNPDAKPHHDELSVNDPEQYFQGDVELSEQQAEGLQEQLLAASEGDETRVKRKVGKEPIYKRWPRDRPISYDFADSIPELTRFKIRDALRIWEQHTCLRFRENGPDVDRLEFFDGGGCSSFVGRAGGTQGVSISTPGCDIVGIITHEVGHALGLFHEQARPDQQEHIAVHYGNIPIGRWNNFHPVTGTQADTFLLPYDAGSVMHYGAYGFASDPYRPTISTLDRSLQSTIGQRAGPSFLDFEAINFAYHCLDKCPPLLCAHGGYTSPNDCSRCECPAGFSGRLCQEVQFSNCGARIMVSKEPIVITTPSFPHFFNPNSYCVWLVEAPPGGRVFLEFVESFHYQCEDTCDKSFVEVHIGPDFRSTGYRHCCAVRPTQQYVSVTNEMLVTHSGFGEQSAGFKAKIWSDKSAIVHVSPRPVLTTSTKSTSTTESSTTSVVVTTTTTTSPPTTTSTSSTTLTTTTEAPEATTTMPESTTTMTEEVTPTEPPVPAFFLISTTRRPWIVHPSTKKTTSVPSTTLPPTTTPSPIRPIIPIGPIIPIAAGDDCACGPWSVWIGACTQQCGGCGKRSRTRQCSSKENCRTEEKRPCNFEACPTGTNFLINNSEFHILWKGCCVGLFRNAKNQCSPLDEGDNPFLRIISSLLSAQDSKHNRTASNALLAPSASGEENNHIFKL